MNTVCYGLKRKQNIAFLLFGIVMIIVFSSCETADEEGDLTRNWVAEFTIQADQEWQEILNVGNEPYLFREVEIEVSGTWSATDDHEPFGTEGDTGSSANSEFLCAGASKFSLIGRIEDGDCFQISDGYVIDNHYSGYSTSKLFISMNDREFSNNLGEMHVVLHFTDVHIPDE